MVDQPRASSNDESTGTSVIRPLVDFLRAEAAGGVVLVAATVVALVWANSPWSSSYADLWNTRLAVEFGGRGVDLTLREWVNDGLMVVFFLVVSLEIKRELVEGELRDPRRASLPVLAAVGGMIVPALLYLALNAGGEGARGWGIPMATDIAMTVGVMSLLGRRVPSSLKLFLLALAIVDDIGAIIVIAVVYSQEIDLGMLTGAVGMIGLVIALRAIGVRAHWVFVVVGVMMWLLLHESGVHATLVGVAMGLLAPTRPLVQRTLVDETELTDLSTPQAALETVRIARHSVSVVEWLEHLLHPWTSFVIVPLFALANAGVSLSADDLGNAASSPITYGVILGLVVGKLVGISGFTWLALRLRIGALPEGVGWANLVGMAVLAGIGFTVSIFVAGLAFDDVALQDEAKIGILSASLIAAIVGTVVLARSTSTEQEPLGDPATRTSS